MSESTLRRYEGDVELARASLKTKLDLLQAPETLSSFSRELKKEARSIQGELVEHTKSAARSQFNGWVEAAKAKAASNPAAALAVGAGLAWHFLRHPPIASGLIGLGLYSLWKTDRGAEPRPETDYLETAKEHLSEQVKSAAEQARDVALEGKERLGEAVRDLGKAAGETARDWSQGLKNAVGDLSEQRDVESHSIAPVQPENSSWSEPAVHKLSQVVDGTRQIMSQQESRDKVLLGLAGAAVVAALGIAFQKRLSEEG